MSRAKNILLVAAMALGAGTVTWSWSREPEPITEAELEALAGNPPPQLRRFHKGGGPCLRWAPDSEWDDSKVSAVTDELARFGASESELSAAFGEFLRRSSAYQKQHHSRGYVEEFLAWSKRPAPFDVAEYDALLDASTMALARRKQAAWNRMSGAEKAEWLAFWRRHRKALKFKALIQLLKSLRARQEQVAKRPIAGIDQLHAAVRRYHAKHGRFPPSAPLTPPNTACRGSTPVEPSAGDWTHPTWKALDFVPGDPGRYQFAFVTDGQKYTARAFGDLDCDGRYSTFERVGGLENGKLEEGRGIFAWEPLE